MRKWLIVLVLIGTGASSLYSQDPEPLHREVKVLDLTGTPYERGLAHGRAWKSEIRELLAAFKQDLERKHEVNAEQFIEQFLTATDFMPAIKQWTPGLLDEVRGIADGADLPFEEVYVLQLADEIWSMGSWALRDKCTSISVNRRKTQPTIVAQNMDLPRFYHKCPALLRIHHDDESVSLVLTCPGLIGINGMNSAGVAVSCNTLLQLRPSRKGVPCLFVVRGVLRNANRAAAVDWLRRIPHAVGQNYTIGDLDEACSYECSAGAVVQFKPDARGDFTYHTNHPKENSDWHPEFVERCKERGQEPANGMGACLRFEALANRITCDKPLATDTIKAALSSRDHELGPICGDWNYACTVFVLKKQPVLLVAPGRPDRYAFQEFGFGE